MSISTGHPRNAMPSLHMGMGIVLLGGIVEVFRAPRATVNSYLFLTVSPRGEDATHI